MSALAPGAEFRCPHGFGQEYRGYTGLMAAPYETCRCCGTSYYYIDSGAYGPKHSKTRTWTHGTCADCGGKYEFYVDGVLVDEAEYRASSTTPVSDDTEGAGGG